MVAASLLYLFRSMLQRSVPNEGGRAVNAWVVFPAMLGGAIAALLFNDYLELPMGSRLSREELGDDLVEFYLEATQRYGGDSPACRQK